MRQISVRAVHYLPQQHIAYVVSEHCCAQVAKLLLGANVSVVRNVVAGVQVCADHIVDCPQQYKHGAAHRHDALLAVSALFDVVQRLCAHFQKQIVVL